MKKVTEKCAKAFINKQNLTVTNTSSLDGCLYLFDNKIAEYRKDGIYISNAGWTTRTTKERLNGLLCLLGKEPIYQKKGEWYWKDGKEFPYAYFAKV